jgi:hypothetical protein
MCYGAGYLFRPYGDPEVGPGTFEEMRIALLPGPHSLNLAKGFALEIPPGFGSQEPEVRSQELRSENSMA